MPPRPSIAMAAACSLCVASAACSGGAGPRPPVYSPAPTAADRAGPVVPPVYMHVVAGGGAVLERKTDDDWSPVCTAPCDGYVPAFGRYRITTPGRDPSPAFTLPGPPGTRVALAVDDDGRVWTRDSAQLAAARARRAAAGATWLALGTFLRR